MSDRTCIGDAKAVVSPMRGSSAACACFSSDILVVLPVPVCFDLTLFVFVQFFSNSRKKILKKKSSKSCGSAPFQKFAPFWERGHGRNRACDGARRAARQGR
jgi:hypothetical protein